MKNKEKAWYQFWKDSNEVQGVPGVQVQSFNRKTNWTEAKYNYAKPYVNEFAQGQYIPFGQDNLYPNILLDMYLTSPFHAALCEFKARSVIAGGLNIEVHGKSLEDKLLKAKIETVFSTSFIKRFVLEHIIHSRNVIKINRGTNKIQIIPAEKVRNATQGYLPYWLSSNWARRRSDMVNYAEYDRYDKEHKEQIKVFQTLTPGIEVYAIPTYATAADWIWTDSQMATFQKQNLENSINPSAIINLYEDPGTEEEKEQLMSDLQRSFAGARNAGKILAFFSNGKELAPEIKMAEPNKLDKSFAATQENIIKNVSYAHLVNPMLMGINTAGSLGQSEELNTAFNIFSTIYLEPTQDEIEDYLNEILFMLGYSAKVNIIRKDNLIEPTTATK